MSNRAETLCQTAIGATFSPEKSGPEQLDNPAWDQSEIVRIERYWSGEIAPSHRHAQAQILWSEQSLSVRFTCRQTEPLIVNREPKVDQKTLGLWNNDVCEIFVAPNPQKPQRYFEFEAAPTGEWVDLGIQITAAGRETDAGFRSGMSVETRIGEGQIIVLMRIPWSESLPKPKVGDAWSCNLFRCVGTGNERYLAWQPTYTPEPYFHVPEVFGRLNFV